MRRMAHIKAAVLIVALAGGCSAPFVGDGIMTDHGLWSYPRYRVQFPAFDARSVSQIAFRCAGVPAARMTLGLVVANVSDEEAFGRTFRASPWQDTMLEVRMETEDGSVVAVANGVMARWELAQQPGQMMLWHSGLRDVPLQRRVNYRIIISLWTAGPAATPLVLSPILQGGGNELP